MLINVMLTKNMYTNQQLGQRQSCAISNTKYRKMRIVETVVGSKFEFLFRVN